MTVEKDRRRPEVVPETTNYGPVVDNLVELSRHDQRDYGINADYDLVRARFDHYHYLLQANGSEVVTDVDPIRHFLWCGAGAPFSPEPGFSMRRYLERYPQHDPAWNETTERSPYLEWVKRGRAAGEIADPSDGIEVWASVLGRSVEDVVSEVVEIRDDLLERLRHGVLGEMYAKAAVFEPLIAETWPETTQIKILPQRGEFVARAVGAIHASQAAVGHRRCRVLIVTDAADGVGPGFVAAIASALSEAIPAEDIVVLRTDAPTDPFLEPTLPAGVRATDFAPNAKVGPELLGPALIALVRSFCADIVLCVDSAMLLGALPSYGKALIASERLVLAFPAEAPPMLGQPPAYASRWFYGMAEYAEVVAVEGAAVKTDLVEHFCLEPHAADRIQVWDASQPDFASQVLELLLPAEVAT